MVMSAKPVSKPAVRKLANASYSDFVRLTPEQNVKLGFGPKTRRDALRDARVTKATATISARAHETKRAAWLFDFSPEQATEARKQGALSYTSADQRERVAKAARTRADKRVGAGVAERARLPVNSSNPKRHGRTIVLRPSDHERYRELRRRKLSGESLPDGDWHWMVDVASHFSDPDATALRASPSAFGFGFAA
jgi:hypothetical protein